jgi:hypothetical protein
MVLLFASFPREIFAAVANIDATRMRSLVTSRASCGTRNG